MRVYYFSVINVKPDEVTMNFTRHLIARAGNSFEEIFNNKDETKSMFFRLVLRNVLPNFIQINLVSLTNNPSFRKVVLEKYRSKIVVNNHLFYFEHGGDLNIRNSQFVIFDPVGDIRRNDFFSTYF